MQPSCSAGSLIKFVALLAFVVAGAAGAPLALAQKGPEKVFAGKVLISAKRFPTKSKSVAAYIAALRKQNTLNIWENKETHQYTVHYAGFLKQPLNDLEISVKLYDLSSRPQALLASFEQYTDQRGQRAIIADFTLEREQVGVNKEVSIQLEYRGRILAAGRFRLLGEAEKHTGKVDFTGDEE